MFGEGTRVEGKFYVDAETSGGEGSGGEQPEQLAECYPGASVTRGLFSESMDLGYR
jgi:hypothetical protein